MNRTILDDILEAVRAVERKVDAMAGQADFDAALTDLESTAGAVQQLVAAQNQNLNRIAAVNAQLKALVPTPEPPPSGATNVPVEQQPVIDPNTGQPVTPV